MVQKEKIIVKGARQHNLKNIDVEIPRDKFVVITGLSGSGKSSLAFDTIYAEGQRRYVESLSAYARQFLGLMEKPDLDSIDGLSPAISIEQKTTSKNPRSTVGTVTEIYDYLRLIFARIGKPHCPKCSEIIKPQTAENITKQILKLEGEKLIILSPVIRGAKGTYEKIFDKLKTDGFARVRVDGEIYSLDSVKDEVKLERYEKHWIEAVVDRIKVSVKDKTRISDSVEQAINYSKGNLIILNAEKDKEVKKQFKGKKIGEKELKVIQREAEKTYSTYGACPNHPEIVFQELEPRMFSFNSPFGACPTCLGLGQLMKPDADLIIPDRSKSIMDGAIKVYGRMDASWRIQQLNVVCKHLGFDVFTPLNTINEEQFNGLMYGFDDKVDARWSTGAEMGAFKNGWEGLAGQTERLFHQTESEYRKKVLEKFFKMTQCPACEGKRLKDTILAVTVKGKSIIDITNLSIEKAWEFFKTLEEKLSQKELTIAKQVLKEINERLSFLNNVGLGYLTLSRSAGTLSGGEAQRIRLATQIGSNLTGVLYILDEPSIGLHQRDNEKLINTLHKLRDIGNTLLVVEHDEDTMMAADWIIDIGPGAGIHGGEICSAGTPEHLMKDKSSLTGKYLSGTEKIEIPSKKRKINNFIELKKASQNNLKNVNVKFPLGVLCGITGVSGSGKSTLTTQTLMPALKKHFGKEFESVGKHESITVPDEVTNVVVIDQSPIGKTPRSNPATYIKVFDEIRTIFRGTKESKARGYKQGRFSFNVPGGRCDTCKGDGVIKIEMNFLPDVYVTCEDCHGKRYNKDTLEITYKGKNIAEVLDMDVEEALTFFKNHPSIKRKLQTLYDVGLGYIKLGQSSVTLSGGESQRIKLTKELAKFKRGHTVYVLDEPTTGLHFEDVRKLLTVLNRLVDKGNSIFVIEHNLDVIKSCDWVIDMGPEGGDGGGTVIATGTPEDIALIKESHTGKFLKKMLK